MSIVIHGRAVTLNHQPFRTIYQSLVNQWRRSRFRMRPVADYLTDRAAQKRDNATHTKITKQRQRELITEAACYENIADMLRETKIMESEK